MKIKIGIVTATRAEYGLLKPVIFQLRQYEGQDFIAEMIVTGTHLSEAYGYTIHEIESDGLRIDHKIEIPVNNATALDISKNQADVLVKFTELFEKEQCSAIMILGDRYEMFAVATAAVNTRTPIIHLCGGDISEGAIDDCIRHCITKMSILHFPTNEESRKRIIQLGEAPDRVFNFGSTSVDNILQAADMSKEEALESIGLKDCRYALCTYHPVTLEGTSVDVLMKQVFDAVREFSSIHFIFTKSNADQGGAEINALLDQAEQSISNLHVYTSLGVRRYLSLMKHSEFVLGNSSSGIVEAPAFQIPTVNIGNRQKGRLRSESILDCGESAEEIIKTVKQALSPEFQRVCQNARNHYGDGHAAERIADKVVEVLEEGIDIRKSFYRMKEEIN